MRKIERKSSEKWIYVLKWRNKFGNVVGSRKNIVETVDRTCMHVFTNWFIVWRVIQGCYSRRSDNDRSREIVTKSIHWLSIRDPFGARNQIVRQRGSGQRVSQIACEISTPTQKTLTKNLRHGSFFLTCEFVSQTSIEFRRSTVFEILPLFERILANDHRIDIFWIGVFNFYTLFTRGIISMVAIGSTIFLNVNFNYILYAQLSRTLFNFINSCLLGLVKILGLIIETGWLGID